MLRSSFQSVIIHTYRCVHFHVLRRCQSNFFQEGHNRFAFENHGAKFPFVVGQGGLTQLASGRAHRHGATEFGGDAHCVGFVFVFVL